MKQRIQTTGELRQFLCDAIVAVKNGDMTLDIASRVSKLASQVTESVYSEAKVMQFQREAGATTGELGALKISQ